MDKQLMLGNEAIARGAWEAGVNLVSSYPGTPSTEITEYIVKYDEIYAEWAPNEKVALEVCAGASVAGARALCCMKHVGLNVAADPLYTAAYTGVNSGLVVVVADDPGMHSSQNEQDSRFHARGSQIPMLEPADSQECVDFVKLAYELSEQYDTPVLVRTTTRIAHARSLVEVGQRTGGELKPYEKNAMKYVMMPGMARARHLVVEERMDKMQKDASAWAINRIEMNDPSVGIICSGIVYEYVKDAMPEASVLKLGLVNPLPKALIEEFAQKVDKLYVLEELEPVIEEQVASWGIACEGKKLTGRQGELSVRKIAQIFGKSVSGLLESEPVPGRPPVMCPGCPHRGPYTVIKKLRLRATGDIGCYTMGALSPTDALDTCLCMGASVGMSHGFDKARGKEFIQKTVAVIGDSTFIHSGITGLINAVYNRSSMTMLILDNSTTGMTGHQPNPATGIDIYGQQTAQISLEQMCAACGVEHIVSVDAFDMAGLEKALKEETQRDAVSVIIARRPCALLDKTSKKEPLYSDPERCTNCKACLRIGCPAIERQEKGVYINPAQCVGCEQCVQMCKFDAIRKVSEQA